MSEQWIRETALTLLPEVNKKPFATLLKALKLAKEHFNKRKIRNKNMIISECCGSEVCNEVKKERDRITRLEADNKGLKEVTRVELIDEKGRQYVGYDCNVELSVQDNGRTLKVFVKPCKGGEASD